MVSLRGIRYALEYAALRAALAVAVRLPAAASERVARALARGAFALAGARRKIASRNVLVAGVAPECNAARRIARASFEHFAVMAVESLKAVILFRGNDWREYVTIEGDAESLALLHTPDQGILMVSAHLGNWETATSLLSGIRPVLGVARPMNNPYVERFLMRKTGRAAFDVLPKHGRRTGAQLVGTLRRGGVVALMIDQHARAHGEIVPFFGLPASTHTAPARLHLATGAPLIPSTCVRVSSMRYRLVLDAPLRFTPTGDRQADTIAILTCLNMWLERWIRRYPEQYLWAHRRWKIDASVGGQSPDSQPSNP